MTILVMFYGSWCCINHWRLVFASFLHQLPLNVDNDTTFAVNLQTEERNTVYFYFL